MAVPTPLCSTPGSPSPVPAASGKPLIGVLTGRSHFPPPFWLMRQAGRYLPEYRAVRAEAGSFLDLCYNPALATEVTLQPIRRYGMDAAILFSDILVVPHALGQALTYVEGEGPRLGPLPSLGSLTAAAAGSSIAQHLQPVYETVGRVRAALPPATALIGFAGAPWTVACYMVSGGADRDWATVRRHAYRAPAELDLLVEVLVAATAEYLIRQVEAGAEVIQLFDTWAGVLAEAPFHRLVIAPTRRIVDRLKARYPEVPVIGFPRGAGLMAEAYAQGTGVDGIGLDWTVPAAWAAAHLQPRWAVQGNLDPILLEAGGPALEETVDRLLATLGGGRYVFNLGHGILPGTPPEHVAALAARLRGAARPGVVIPNSGACRPS